MVEQKSNYPAYLQNNEKVNTEKVALSFTYEQLLEIANIIYYVNKVAMRLPRFIGGIRPLEKLRILHKSIHDTVINCCLSLEERKRLEEKEVKE